MGTSAVRFSPFPSLVSPDSHFGSLFHVLAKLSPLHETARSLSPPFSTASTDIPTLQ